MTIDLGVVATEEATLPHLPVGRVHYPRIAVTDVQRSTAFYTEVLGFEMVGGPPPPDDENHDAFVDSLQGGVILMHHGCLSGSAPSTTSEPMPPIGRPLPR